jgi:site-specific recombinase XerD
MTPQEKKTTTDSIALFKQTLLGNNYSPQSIKAYLSDLEQFVAWLQKRRVDWELPYRIQRIDIVEFINDLGAHNATAQTRKRKLATIRGFLKFLKDNQIIFGNPAETIEGPLREERDPAILLKTEYKVRISLESAQ